MELLKALIGGLLIGSAGILLLIADGRIAGISGMIGALFRTGPRLNSWRYAFLGGLLSGGLIFHLSGFTVFVPLENRSLAAILLAGLLVGLGTQLGSGCTSGHGVCGMGRGSMRSLIATLTFMAAGVITVLLIRVGTGGGL